MTLKIKNETDYETRDLRKIFLECMKREGVQRCNLTVRYSRCDLVHGSAYYNSTRVNMFLPKKNPNIIGTAQVFIHELGHNRGLKHREMVELSKIDCSWIMGFKIDKKIPKDLKKIPKDLKKERHEHAKKKLKQLTSRLKLMQTLIKKWQRKVRYYEKSSSEPFQISLQLL